MEGRVVVQPEDETERGACWRCGRPVLRWARPFYRSPGRITPFAQVLDLEIASVERNPEKREVRSFVRHYDRCPKVRR